MFKIIIKNDDGTIGVLTPAPELFDKESRTYKYLSEQGVNLETKEDVIKHVIVRNNLTSNYDIIDENSLNFPEDRYFRQAWTFDKDINIDIDKAKEIHINNLRKERNLKLQELDIETMKNITNKPKLIEIENQKQLLRDMPEEIRNEVSLTTPEDIKSFTPTSFDVVIPDNIEAEK